MSSRDTRPTFDDVAEFVRRWARIPARIPITPDTQFEEDLGITGDDGGELLEAAEVQFKVKLQDGENGFRTVFELGPNEYLFNSEGLTSGSGIQP